MKHMKKGPRGNDRNKNPQATTALRRRAEDRLRAKSAMVHVPSDETESQRLFHELQVHQIELEMQNEELRQAKEELETALDRYTDLYDFAPVGYLTLDRNGIITAANLGGASLLGTERSKLLGQRFGLFVPADSRPTFFEFLGKVFATQAKASCETALTNEGKPPLFVQIEALACKSGQECRIAITDISERRQMEEKIQILNADLAADAVELKNAIIELEAFNYSVSHDLRTPVAAINGYCQVIQAMFGNKLEEQCQGYIREIYESTLRMERLIDGLLRFSCVLHGEMHWEKVDLSAIAKSVVSELVLVFPENRVTFVIAPGTVAEGDPELLWVVLDNLIGNAWKYSDNREGTVIEFAEMVVEGKPAYFVRDNGPGFEMAFADKLFLPFQRHPGKDVEGFGIGLATVERIVRRHGGHIWAESEPGKGATFLFNLNLDS